MKLIGVNIDEAKQISKHFITHVKGKSARVVLQRGHDGAVGHILEDLFEIQRNRMTEADFDTIELKIKAPKVSLGDWSPDIGKYSLANNPSDGRLGKRDYLRDYGKINEKGEPHVTGPFYGDGKIHKGLILCIIDKDLFLIDVEKKVKVVGWSHERLKSFVESKFGKGTAVVDIDKATQTFVDLNFFPGFNVEFFYKGITEGSIYYDPGTNLIRPYSQFRFRKKGMAGLPSINYRKFL